MTRPTPLCHLTIGPSVVIRDGDGEDALVNSPLRICLGSRCSAWQQMTIPDEGPALGRCGLVLCSQVTAGTWSDPIYTRPTP